MNSCDILIGIPFEENVQWEDRELNIKNESYEEWNWI
jgi:hypothetical protein